MLGACIKSRELHQFLGKLQLEMDIEEADKKR